MLAFKLDNVIKIHKFQISTFKNGAIYFAIDFLPLLCSELKIAFPVYAHVACAARTQEFIVVS